MIEILLALCFFIVLVCLMAVSFSCGVFITEMDHIIISERKKWERRAAIAATQAFVLAIALAAMFFYALGN